MLLILQLHVLPLVSLSIKSTCKLSVCLNKNLRWLNEQVKRVLRYLTRPISRLYDFQMRLQCWRYNYHLPIWRCLSNYDVRYLCDILNLVKAMFFCERTRSYACCYLLVSFIQRRFEFFNKICLTICLPPPHNLIWPLTSVCCNSSCRICCQ